MYIILNSQNYYIKYFQTIITYYPEWKRAAYSTTLLKKTVVN